MNLLLVCLNSSICCALALKSVTGRYECSEDLLDDRRGSLKFITPLDVSFGKSTKYWLSMIIEILTSSNLRNWNSICARNPKYLSVSSTNTFARYFESHWRETWRHTGRIGGLHHRFPWRHLPHPVSFLLRTKSRGRPSGPSPCAFPVGAWYSHLLFYARKTVWPLCVTFVTNKKKHEDVVAKKGLSLSPN